VATRGGPKKGDAAHSTRAASRSRDNRQPVLHEHRRLVHELEVHQLELELQNRALRDAQGSLEESRARYAELYDYAPIGHLTLDRSGIVRELNLTAASLLEKERRFLIGRPLRPLLAAQSRRALDAHLRACFKSAAVLTVELAIPRSEGALRVVELVSVPPPSNGLDVADERARILNSALVDVSQRKRDEQRQIALLEREREARVLAEGANRMKQEFLAVVSHELRTPLAPMMMWVKALRAGGISDSLRARAIEALDTCLKVEAAMIDDLVDVARGQHGKLRIERVPIDLQSVVGAAIEALAPSAAAKQIEVTLEVDATPAWVSGDSTRLQQVATNLLSNAIKFTPEAGHVALTLRTHEADVVLAIRDDGEGIQSSLLAGVFEPFRQQDDPAPRRHGGLGLGLTIVRQLVTQHDGHVVAASEGVGRGACFTVTLPALARAAARDGEASARTVAKAAARARPLDRLRILVVEDDEATRDALAATLGTYGADVTTAASAAAGRAVLRRTSADVLVSDIGLPAEDGCNFIRKLRAREKRTKGAARLPALALTAHTSERERARALASGFDRQLAKPIEFDLLVSTIRALARPGPVSAM
jgi:signal transduction histidine kinase/ActR/RegA family two-component response regulator